MAKAARWIGKGIYWCAQCRKDTMHDRFEVIGKRAYLHHGTRECQQCNRREDGI